MSDTVSPLRDERFPDGGGRPLARRVRKFGRGGFAGESCRSREAWRPGVRLATATPPFSLIVSSGTQCPSSGFVLEPSSCSAEHLSSDGEGERSPSSATQNALRHHWNPWAFAGIALRCLARCPVAAGEPKRPRGQDFPVNPARPNLRTLRPKRRQKPRCTVYDIARGAYLCRIRRDLVFARARETT